MKSDPIELFDTHCHIHFSDYELDPEEVISTAQTDGVTKLLCVGCTLEDSKLGIAFAARHEHIWTSIGLHPHEAKHYVNDEHALQEFHSLASKPKVVAVGEIGLDYYYGHSDRQDQIKMLRFQLTVAQEHNLPVIFHVRDAKGVDPSHTDSVWQDFWTLYDEFKPKGVIHSFSAGMVELEQILKRDLLVGLNGIMTFTKNQDQLDAAKAVPLKKIILETDAPFLTPSPFRGTICQPKHVRVTAEFLSNLRSESFEEFARATTNNAQGLFTLCLK